MTEEIKIMSQNMHRNKWKWKHDNPKPMGFSKAIAKGKAHSSMEKETATHSSILAWSVLWTVEHGGLSSVGSHRVGHDWSDLAAAALQYMLTSRDKRKIK